MKLIGNRKENEKRIAVWIVFFIMILAYFNHSDFVTKVQASQPGGLYEVSSEQELSDYILKCNNGYYDDMPTLKLVNDITMRDYINDSNSILVSAKTNVCIDLNGHSISFMYDCSYEIVIEKSAHVEIIDSVGGGSIKGRGRDETMSNGIKLSGELTINAGAICGFNVGISVVEEGKLILNDGKIKQCKKAVNIEKQGSFIMNGGEISYNNQAVSIRGNQENIFTVFTMNNGVITKNEQSGPEQEDAISTVFVGSYAHVNLLGGAICENKANYGAVGLCNNFEDCYKDVLIGGNIKIVNNYCYGSDLKKRNIIIYDDAGFLLGEYTEDFLIGVSFFNEPNASKKIAFAYGVNVNEDCVNNILSDRGTIEFFPSIQNDHMKNNLFTRYKSEEKRDPIEGTVDIESIPNGFQAKIEPGWNFSKLSSAGYQWQKSVDGNEWTDINMAIGTSYTVTDDLNGYYFRVRVYDKSKEYLGDLFSDSKRFTKVSKINIIAPWKADCTGLDEPTTSTEGCRITNLQYIMFNRTLDKVSPGDKCTIDFTIELDDGFYFDENPTAFWNDTPQSFRVQTENERIKRFCYEGVVVPQTSVEVPQELKAVYHQSGKPKLTWNCGNNIDYYIIYRGFNRGYSRIGTSDSNEFIDWEATVGNKIEYFVKAVSNDEIESAISNESVTIECTEPMIPVVVAKQTSEGKPELIWEDLEDAKSYILYRSTDEHFADYQKIDISDGSSYIDNEAQKCVTYYYKLCAVYREGLNSDFGDTIAIGKHDFSGSTYYPTDDKTQHYQKCKDCGAKSIPVAHSETVLKNKKEPTCVENGYSGDTCCKDCGAIISLGTEENAKGHTWDEGKVTKEPTEYANGEKLYTCTTCGVTKSETLDKLAPVDPTPKPTPSPTPDVKPVAIGGQKLDISDRFELSEGEKIAGYRIKDKKEKKIASVNKKGIVTPKKTGTVHITAYKKEGKTSVDISTIELTVVVPTFDKKAMKATYPEQSVRANLILSDYEIVSKDQTVIWKSSKTKIASIDPQTGLITAHKTGKTTISITFTNKGGKSVTKKTSFTVKIPKLNVKDKITLSTGKTKKLSLAKTDKTDVITWESSDTSIVKVIPNGKNAKITAVAGGEATVTANVNGHSYKTVVTVP